MLYKVWGYSRSHNELEYTARFKQDVMGAQQILTYYTRSRYFLTQLAPLPLITFNGFGVKEFVSNEVLDFLIC